MGSARDSFRVEYSRGKDIRAAREAFSTQVAKGDFDGEYYRVLDQVRQLPDGRVRLKAVSTSGKLEVGTVEFELESGQSDIKWHDSDPDK